MNSSTTSFSNLLGWPILLVATLPIHLVKGVYDTE